jgi:hypothetical protein
MQNKFPDLTANYHKSYRASRKMITMQLRKIGDGDCKKILRPYT